MCAGQRMSDVHNMQSLPPFPRPLQIRPPPPTHVPVGIPSVPMQEDQWNKSNTRESPLDNDLGPINRRDLYLITETLQSDLASAAKAAVNDALKQHFDSKSLQTASSSPDDHESQSPSKQRKKKSLPSHRNPAQLEFLVWLFPISLL